MSFLSSTMTEASTRVLKKLDEGEERVSQFSYVVGGFSA